MIVWLAAWTGMAFAARDVQVCGQWTPDLTTANYQDNDGVDTNGDGVAGNDISDFLYDNSPQKTHGLAALLEYRRVQPPWLPADPWSEGWEGNLTVGGADGGCTPVVTLPVFGTPELEVRVTLTSKFLVPGQLEMPVLDDATNNALSAHIGPIIHWAVTDPVRQAVHLGSADSQIDVAIILALALHREDGGVTDLDWTIYNSYFPGGKGKIVPSTEDVYVGPDTNVRRVLHEFGHVLARERTRYQTSKAWRNREATDSLCPARPLGDPDDGATKHYSNSDEATALAIAEGIASYYWAQTVNRVDEGDCFVAEDSWKDWNHSNFSQPDLLEQEWYSCDIAPAPGLFLSDEDYWADECDNSGVTGDFVVASEYDWLRGFWDMDTAYTYTYSDMLDVFEEAHPYANSSVVWVKEPTYDPTLVFYHELPHMRMQSAANALGAQDPLLVGLGIDWGTEAVANGMYR